jgi:hypothetical protein
MIDGKSEAYDLIALQGREHSDLFSTFVCEQALTIFKVFGRFMNVNERLGGICFHDHVIQGYTYKLTAIIADIVTAISFYLLSPHQSSLMGCSAMALGNLFVMGCVVIFTEARRVDLFIIRAL